jgi:hypothetical protein
MAAVDANTAAAVSKTPELQSGFGNCARDGGNCASERRLVVLKPQIDGAKPEGTAYLFVSVSQFWKIPP